MIGRQLSEEEKNCILRDACRFWFVLGRKTQADLRAGICVYSEHEGIPVIDYTQKNAILYEPSIA